MSSTTQTFTGINATDGFQELDLGALPAGWVSLPANITLPPGASGIIISSPMAWSWCLSPDATTANPLLLGMPVEPNAYAAIVGRDNLAQLVVQGTGVLALQFTTGSTGDMPILP